MHVYSKQGSATRDKYLACLRKAYTRRHEEKRSHRRVFRLRHRRLRADGFARADDIADRLTIDDTRPHQVVRGVSGQNKMIPTPKIALSTNVIVSTVFDDDELQSFLSGNEDQLLPEHPSRNPRADSGAW